MIETRPNASVENTNVTPTKITVNMILKDLSDGITKKGMCTKYNVKKWEMDEVFKHPKLKGKRPAYVKVLSFTFVDDTEETDVVVPPNTVAQPDKEESTDTLPLNSGDIAVEQAEEVDPNQVTIDQVIKEEDELEIPTLPDTLELVKEQQMEEIEEDDFGSFELN